jgi:hypothetical protein
MVMVLWMDIALLLLRLLVLTLVMMTLVLAP